MIPKMDLCRACLSSDKELILSDDDFVYNYNLLTNINVKFSDGKPDHFCRTCMEIVHNFIEFRNKCISAECTLRGIIEQVVKSETVEQTGNANVIKVEVKCEEEYLDLDPENYLGDDSDMIKTEECFALKKKKPRKKCKKKCTKVKEEKIKVITGDSMKLTSDKPICGLCTKEFEDTASLNAHLTGHEVSKGCQLCSADHFPDWPRLLAHRLLHTKYHQKCHLCGVKFRSHNNLEFHYRKVHTEEKHVTIECHLCSKKYDSPIRLKKHIWTSHNSSQYICDVCSKSYNNKQKLKLHLVSHGDVKPYGCDFCDYRSKYHGGLVAHTARRHAPLKERCEMCHGVFADAARLARHVCTDKSRVCPICGKTLLRGFSRHMATHSTEARYKCDRCPTAYRSRSALKVHKDKHDGVPKHQCQYCLRRFYSPSVLIKHRRVHTGEKPYACKKCDMRFTAGHNLKVHMRVHGEMLVVKRSQEEAV